MLDRVRLSIARAIAPKHARELPELQAPDEPRPRPAEAPYEAHSDDPPALLRVCPACAAPVGTWCGGIGDIHPERHDS